jgi:outer membrane protein OmpA-like peptidoglycan-associated protein
MRLRPLVLSCVLGFGFVLGTGPASAQQDGEFSVQRFEPAPGPDNFVTVEGARVTGNMAWSAGLFANYAHKPFVVRSCVSATNCDEANALLNDDIAVVRDLMTADVLASLTPFPKLQIGLRVPLTFVNGDGINTETGQPATDGLSGFGLGDPMLEGKFRFFGEPDTPLVLAGGLFVSAPVGHAMAEDKYIGYSSPVAGLRGIADFRTGPLSLGANLAGLYRSSATLGSTELGPEFRYGGAVGYDVSPVFTVMGEGYGGTKFSTKNGTNSLEGIAAARITPLQSRFSFTIGGGAGVLQGVGVPMFRGFVGVLYSHAPVDTDGDGIPDDRDQCPTEPEDFDGFEDEDGCPDPDNDGDGIPDHLDKCPNQPENMNGYQDEDGCPDEPPDRDKDGIPDDEDKCPDAGGEVIRVKGPHYGCPDRDKDGVPDHLDKCPDEPEDTDGYQDEDGCPDPDNDGDGIPDIEDQCVDVPGSKENHGCPFPDRDGDGIPDHLDKCPDEPENFNGFQDDDGCPDNRPTLVTQTADSIEIKGSVEFATNSAKIVGAKSFQILDGVSALMVHNLRIQQVEVQGHTDDRGGEAANKKLSQERAEAVVKYLTEKGVQANRLTAVGHGQEKPIADNKTADGRQKNRRVEFKILRQAK